MSYKKQFLYLYATMNTPSKQRPDNIHIVVLSEDPDLDADLRIRMQHAGFPVRFFNDPDEALAWEQSQDDSTTRFYLIAHAVRGVSWKTIIRRFQQQDMLIDAILLLSDDDPSTVHQVKRFGVHEVCSTKDHDIAVLPAFLDKLARRIVSEKQEKAAHGGLSSEGLPSAKEFSERVCQAKSAFLAKGIQEVRKSLDAVMDMAKTLEKTHLDKAQQKYLRSILIASNNILFIFNDMLDDAKLESRKLDVACSHFSLQEAIEEVINLHSQDAAEKNNALELYVDTDVPAIVSSDKHKVQQGLSNLVSNAIRHTADGEVSVMVQMEKSGAQEDSLQLTVKDTGIGVPPDKVPDLLDPYTRMSLSGIIEKQEVVPGLLIAKGLAELLGGRLDFESQPGQGSQAVFSIPLAKEQVPKVSDSDEGAYAVKSASLKVLIAEDDAINQMYLAGLLRSQGWEVDTAFNGLKALEKFQQKRYDIVLLDCQMPRMDGFEAAKKIRELEAGKEGQTPIVAITGYAMPGEQERFYDAGMDAYLTKPIEEKKLMDTIGALISGGNKKS